MDRDDQQGGHRPSDHVEQFKQLPRSTREWLQSRRKEDWDRIDRALAAFDRLQDRGKFLMWILGGLLTVFLGFGAFSDQVIRILNWLRGHP